MAQFYCLFSSSKGNAHYVGTENGGLLIDAGVACTRLRRALLSRQIPLSAIKGILITHTHSDHIKGLAILLKQTTANVWATAETLTHLQEKGVLSTERIGGVMVEGEPVQITDYEVKAFATPHDAVGSCGYHIKTPDGRRCGVCTDLGCIPENIMETLQGCHLVLLEANYDQKLLTNGNYPMYLKCRILSRTGHLSNDACADAALQLVRGGTTRLILGHLSLENNRPELAYQAVMDRMAEEGFLRNQDYLLTVSTPNGCEGTVSF